jgi:hypothetical protein
MTTFFKSGNSSSSKPKPKPVKSDAGVESKPRCRRKLYSKNTATNTLKKEKEAEKNG